MAAPALGVLSNMSDSSPPSGAGRLANAAVAVVIVNYRIPDLVERCLIALVNERAGLPKLRAVVVDGGSADGSAEELAVMAGRAEYCDWVSFLPLSLNGGFGWANNQAILRLAREPEPPELIHLLNPDTQVTHGAVAHLVAELLAHQECAAVGSQLLSDDEQAAASAFRFPSAGREFVSSARSEVLGRLIGIAPSVIRSDESTDVDWVTGASVMLRSAALRQSGLFDDGFFLYFDEVELMHRLRAARWTVRHVPQSRVIHSEGSATGIAKAAEARALPDYWYQSRRRYFALTGGCGMVVAANLASLGGHAVARLKPFVGGSVGRSAARPSDLFRSGFWPRRRDSVASVPAWGDAPGQPPGWMHR